MDYLKWQDIPNYVKSIGGSIGMLSLIVLVFNLAGMRYVVPKDITCGTDCYSEVWVNSTYWEIKVEHSGDMPMMYKKVANSRTLWVNLDKVDMFIETNPEVEVEIMVRTTSRYATIKHPEYGYLRPIKDGDFLVKRKSEKYNPNGWKFYVHGSKEAIQTVKWGMNLDSLFSPAIDFDPKWIGKESPEVIRGDNCNDYYNTDTKTGTVVLGAFPKHVRYEGKCTDIKTIPSLKALGRFEAVYLQEDKDFKITVKDFNYTHIDFDIEALNEKELNKQIPIKIDNVETASFSLDAVGIKAVYEPELDNVFNHNYTFGKASTTIHLADPDTENMEDAYVDKAYPNDPHDEDNLWVWNDDAYNQRIYTKYNLTSIFPTFVIINNAELFMYAALNTATWNTSLHHITDHNWDGHDEADITFNNQVCGANFDDSSDCNLTAENITYVSGAGVWYGFNVTRIIKLEHSYGNNNVSMVLKSPEDDAGIEYLKFWDKEYGTVSLRPHLNISYTRDPDTIGPMWLIGQNGTNSTLAGSDVLHYVNWTDTLDNGTAAYLSSYVFSFWNGSNTTSCAGTLDCSAYLTEASCENCSQCDWTTVEENFIDFETYETDYGDYDYDDGDAGCDWLRDQDGTPSSGTGPQPQGSAPGAAGTDYYVFVESSSGQCDNGEQAYLWLDKEIDLDTYPNTNVSFYYSMYGANMGTLNVQLNTSGTWTTIWTISGNQGADPVWTSKNLSLSDYSGKVVVRFEYDRTASGYWGDIALDHINVSQWEYTGCVEGGSCSACIIEECDTNCSVAGCSVLTQEFINNSVVYFNDDTWSNVTKTINSTTGATIKWKIYANDSYNNWNVTDEWSYTTTSVAGDTCDYSSGDFEVDCSEYCTVDTDTDTGNNDMILTGVGTVFVDADITTRHIIKSGGCHIVKSGGKKIIKRG